MTMGLSAMLLCAGLLAAMPADGRVTGRRRCYDDWTRFGQSCYLFVKDKQTWPSAQMTCRTLGGNLVRIGSSIENAFIYRLLSHHKVKRAWIGLSDLGSEGHFRWIFSHGKARFLAFHPKEPNNLGGSENCVEVVDGRGWNDQPCTSLFYFFCEA
ncbi:hypothetical protein ACOMHN_050553 [Nucella lapillus]